MRLPDDDELYEIDQSYLGPPGRYLGVLRYKAIFAWLALGPMIFVIERKVGMPFTLLSVGLTVIAITAAAGLIADKVTPERPLSALARTFWAELTAPRALSGHSRARGAGSYTRALHPRGRLGTWLARRDAAAAAGPSTTTQGSTDVLDA